MMTKKTILAMNVAWAAVAAGAFLLGKTATPDTTENSAGLGGESGSVGSSPSGFGASAGQPGGQRAGSAEDGAPASAEDFERRMTSALAEVDPLRRKARVGEILMNLTPEMVPGLLAAFESADGDRETDDHFRDFLYAWGRLGGEEAVAYMMDPESSRKTQWGATSAVSGWAAVDPVAAKNFVAGIEEQGTREWLHYGVFRQVLRTDLNDAIAYSEKNDRSRARGWQLDQLGKEVFQQRGMDGMMQWVESIDHTGEGKDLLGYKQYATSMALDKMASEDPAAASAWLVENTDQAYVTADSLERAARRAGGPIGEELDWIASLPEEVGQRRHALGERFEDYIREDFAGAGEWLARQPLGPAYDEAIQDYARSAARDDPAAAMAWAERISDPKLREETMRRLAPGGGEPQRQS